MDKFAGLTPLSTGGQAAILLMIALRNLQHGPTKQECLSYISENQWFDIKPDDIRPYPGATHPEPRWHTLMSWARENCARSEFLERKPMNSWRPTQSGLNAAVYVRKAFQESFLDIRKAYLWTPAFKKFMCENYLPTMDDASRPKYVYEDTLPFDRKSVRGNETDRWIDDIFG